MTASTSKRTSKAILIRNARIISGLFLLAYITTHLVNMMLGLHSVALVDEMRPYLSGLWTGPIGSKVLMIVLLTHFALGLESIYRRETLRMSVNDMVQFVAGLLIVPMLMPHAFGIAAAVELMSEVSYNAILRLFWLQDPIAGLRQVLLVGIVWVHGCMGLFIWMRSKDWSARVLPWLYPLAVAIPVLALLGYVEAGREILAQSEMPAVVSYVQPEVDVAPVVQVETAPKRSFAVVKAEAEKLSATLIWITTILVVLTLLARLVRVSRNRKNMIEIDYVYGPIVTAQSGPSLLDIARHNDLPHANICQGRGRCGTCRVRILSSSVELPPPSKVEQATLDRLECEPGIRLACQLSPPGGNLRIERLLSPDHKLGKKPDTATLAAEVI